jgi:acyl-CoA thioesterase-1
MAASGAAPGIESIAMRYVSRRGLVKAALALLLGVPGGARAEEPIRLALLGDSLTAGYGLAPSDALSARLQAALRAAGYDIVVMDAGVSGDTSAGGLARLDWVLGDEPDIMLVALGANDALRGLPPEATHDNLDAILRTLAERGVVPVLAGMKAPRNLGNDYVAAFDGLYPRLAQDHGVALYTFLLEGVAMDPALNQADGIHPNAAGVDRIVEGLIPVLAPVLDAFVGG